MRLPRLTTRRLMVLVAALALVPPSWNIASGRRARYIELADRHDRVAIEMSRNIQGLAYAPRLAGHEVRLSEACRRAANDPYEDFLTGRWSSDYWSTPWLPAAPEAPPK